MKNKKIIGVVLCSLAGLLMIYTVWAFIHSIGYISELISSGQLAFAGSEYDIVSFVAGSTVQYFVFAVLITGMGLMISGRLEKERVGEASFFTQKQSVKNEDDSLDEWFEEVRGENKPGSP